MAAIRFSGYASSESENEETESEQEQEEIWFEVMISLRRKHCELGLSAMPRSTGIAHVSR
ncbi:MAG: hypothetical protein Ct9H90mP21_1200 [Methanobacteriota archaeon]|nr:MAG: hypothetical protein Ct9H90mP21_1200 [Euryarchaeota archaeon]